jgi:acetolactate synthase-1/2/3 large subunit
MLAAAARPVALVGFGAVDDAAAVRAALELLACPVLTTYQAAGVLPEAHPQLAGSYTGGVLEHRLLDDADLVVAVGLDTVEPIPTPWSRTVPVLSIDVAPAASSYLPTSLAVEDGSIGAALRRVVGAPAPGWSPEAGARALEVTRTALAAVGSARRPGTLGPLEVARTVARCTPSAATVTVDAGAHFLAIMPFWPASAPLRLLISNGLATMGFALPAAVGAALARPGTPVVCLVGDGGLGMTLAELETVARLALPITVVVFDDAALSLIEIKQLPDQGGTDAVRYAPIDFAAVARAMGLDAVTVTTVPELETALDGGWGGPRLVDARIDPAPYRALLDATRD